MKAPLYAVTLALAFVAVARADDPQHVARADLDTLLCGGYMGGSVEQGAELGPSRYDFSLVSTSPADASRAADHQWVQVRDSTELVFDMGRPVSSVVVLPAIDRAGVPEEAFEYTAYGSDVSDPGALGEQGTIALVYDQGFSDWVSDDSGARWTFSAPHRFVHITAGGPGAALADGDAEIDTVCSDLPPPEPLKTANAVPQSGSVQIKEPGTTTFVPLASTDQIPVGSVLNATDGTVELATSDATGKIQSAAFTGGEFKLVQNAALAGVTELRLQGGASAALCRSRKAAVHSARRRPSKRVLRQLFGNGHGVYKANGRHANLTIRGTSFLIQDRCDGTYIKLMHGKGQVFDKVRHRTVALRAGQAYLARSR